MTQEEKQEIINAVLSAIMTNSKTIEQLTPTESLSDDDAIEVSGGRRISYAAFLSAVQEGVQLMLDGYLTGEAAVAWFAALENNPANYVGASADPVQLHWRQSPIVLLDSMGEDLDGDDDFTAQVGDKWWDPSNDNSRNYIFLKTSTGQAGWPIGSGNVNGVLYVNKRTGRMYLWDGTDMVELVGATGGGGGNVTIEEGQDYIDITIDDNVPVIEVSTQSIVMSGQTKTATFTVSGHNLTAPIRINGGNAYFSKSPSSISPVGGIVEATTVTVTFGGSTDDTDDLIVSSVGATSKTVHVAYSAAEGPNIVVSPASLSFRAATGDSETKAVSVQGSLLDADVDVSASSPFAVSLDGTTFSSSVTIPKATAMAGITVYVRYTAGSSASTGTLTLESTGATSKTVDLTGAVVSLTVSESSLSFSTTAGTPVTQTFTVQGANLTQDISISASGTGFSVLPATIDKDDAGTAQTVTVTYNPSAAGNHTGTVTIQSSGLSQTIDLSGTAVAVPVGNYIQEGLVFHLDGIEKGSVSGKWIDCKGGAEWVNHGATSLQNGFSFDGVDDYFEGVDSGVYTDDAYTIEVVFDSETSGSVYFVFVDAYGREIMCYVPNFQSKEWYLSKSAAAQKNNPNPYGAIVVNGDGGTGVKIVSLTTAATGTNGGVVNGVAKSTNICEYSCDAIGRIGCRRKDSVNNFFFKGKVYSVRIYNRRLTTSEMKQNQVEDNTRFNLGLTIE